MACTTAPSDSIETWICSSGGVRIFNPFMSSGALIGRTLLVTLRKPYSQLRSRTKPCFSASGASHSIAGPSRIGKASSGPLKMNGSSMVANALSYLSSCPWVGRPISLVPSLICCACSGGPPSWLFGKIAILIAPSVRFSIWLANCLAAILAGWPSSAKCAKRIVMPAARAMWGAAIVRAAAPALAFRKFLRSMVYPPVICRPLMRTLSAKAEIVRQEQRERWHERHDQKSDQQHDEIGKHGARCGLDIAAHHRAADVESHTGERHEA